MKLKLELENLEPLTQVDEDKTPIEGYVGVVFKCMMNKEDFRKLLTEIGVWGIEVETQKKNNKR